jgi:hypothetical protein
MNQPPPKTEFERHLEAYMVDALARFHACMGLTPIDFTETIIDGQVYYIANLWPEKQNEH